jgi:hypothetical protein
MPTRVISIEGCNPSTGYLDLSDHGHTEAAAGDTILWQIKQGSGVDSITAIQPKSPSNNFWSSPPHRQGNNWTGDINSTDPINDEYVYSITWTGKGKPHVFDPKISIKPSM